MAKSSVLALVPAFAALLFILLILAPGSSASTASSFASSFASSSAASSTAAAAAAAATAAAATTAPFLIMGDWGGDEAPPFTTPEEVMTAAGMGKVALRDGAKHALVLGDNFYHDGVTGIEDPRFQTTFEDVFTHAALQDPFRFHLVAGNHDYLGDVQAQMAYSARSARWHFPSAYYTFTDGDVQFVMIDTIILAGNNDYFVHGDKILSSLSGAALHRLFKKAASDEMREAQQAQLAWIEDTLRASTAPYIVVGGHYPVWSICGHGPTTTLIHELKPLLEKYKVTAYVILLSCTHVHVHTYMYY